MLSTCEKCLKAVLSAVGVEITRTHDLARLLALLVTQGIELPADAQWIDELTPYAVDARQRWALTAVATKF